MQCALCLRERELEFSHIIPEFLYKSSYDDKHRLHFLSTIPEEKNQLKQKGEREYLLCTECEGLFSKYERYGSLLLSGRLQMQVERDDNLLILSGIDYRKFKIFQLSILWKAGVSTLPLFERVQLGPHAESIRQLLISEDPGLAEQYACIMWLLATSTGVVPRFITQPTALRSLGVRAYKFIMAGLMWQYFVTSQKPGYPFQYCILRETGEAIMQFGDINEMCDLRIFAQQISRLGRAPKP